MGQRWFRTVNSVVALLTLAGCCVIPFQQSPEDPQITRDVRTALAADTTPGVNQVNATSYGGFAILSGWAHGTAAVRASQVAGKVPEAHPVNLIIVPGTW